MIDCPVCVPELGEPFRVPLCDCQVDCGEMGCAGHLRDMVRAIGAGQCPDGHGLLETGWFAGWCGTCGGMWEIVQTTCEGVAFTAGWAVAVGAPPGGVPRG
jgi:hypothetical protein